jgi:hypothetical protein
MKMKKTDSCREKIFILIEGIGRAARTRLFRLIITQKGTLASAARVEKIRANSFLGKKSATVLLQLFLVLLRVSL